ncbi:MAG: ABC-F family ATP-binding cassette domain-containing protein [Acidobacteriota bacterium]|nr:ABC-F family ATP-binding cassette domain-containing protein [Acidobacteriota bacterium]
MIQLSGAGKRFGPKILYEGLDWLIGPKEKAGIVGGNGTGKSTLLKVLGGMETLDYGSVSYQKGVKTGYLPQDGLSLSGRTVFAECLGVFEELKAMEMEQEELSHKLSILDHESPEYADVADRFHHIQNEFTARDGYNIESKVGEVLTGLGFSREDWGRRTEEFSGGWQMRIALAKLLLMQPNLLLLDEPTNHLDIEARDWLEAYLNDYPHSFILISHDRYFLDVTVKKVVEIWNKRAHFFSGNYSKYEVLKVERRTQLEAAFKNQRDKVEQLEAFINKFRYTATKAKQVQSRIKELEKIDRIEIPNDEKTIHFRFPQPKQSGRIVAEFRNVSKDYGTKHVLGDVSFNIERGDRIALVGVNGAGKSTLIKLLAGAEPVSSGEFTLGHNVITDYFAQDQYKELDPAAEILNDIGQVAPRATQTELRSVLGSFLFSDDDVFKRIGVLSGGERNRYALARMLMQPGNFLLLDEPTNHLDMRSKDVLLEALRTFTGTVVFVSHDRYFLEQVATRVFEVGGGKVEVFPGNYEDYIWRKNADAATLAGKVTLAPPPVPKPVTAAPPPQNNNKIKKLKERHQALEDKVAKLEEDIANHERELAHFKSVEETLRVNRIVEDGRTQLQTLLSEWEQLGGQIETLVGLTLV